MLKEYEISQLEQSDYDDRIEMLTKQKFSVIVEGNFLEYDNADEWITLNLGVPVNQVFYGKTGYDYGFMEYFFANETDSIRFKEAIPKIYTVYPDGSHSKSDGYNTDIPIKG
jgi:hypothetical protein